MTFNEHDHPRGDAGRFTETHHAESSGVTLQGPASSRPELEGYDIPAPLATQKFLDGSRIPEGASFEEAYEEFFRPLDEYEAAHGSWETTRPPSEEQLRDLAGLTGVDLGRTTGFELEIDKTTGDPVIAATTTNGSARIRECANADSSSDSDCMTCHPCIQEHVIPSIPTHIRDVDDEDAAAYVTSYFRPTDPAAAARFMADRKTRETLNHRTWAREAITSGKQPPWAILSPVRNGKERHELDYTIRRARTAENLNANDQRYAMLLAKAVESGDPLPEGHSAARGALIDSAGYRIYGEAIGKHQAEAARLRQEAATLAAERTLRLPPAISALAAAEADRLAKAVSHEEEKAQRAAAQLEKSKDNIRRWAERRLQHAAGLRAAVKTAVADMNDFDWSSSWPGDPAACPPRRAAS